MKFEPVDKGPEVEVRPIPGYEGRYAASADGRIWSHAKVIGRRRHGGLWLHPGINTFGYEIVVLAVNGKRRTVRVHRAVASAWLPNPDGLPDINHKSGVKTDNRVENLEWCTTSHNIRHAHEIGLNRTRRILSPERLAQVRAALARKEKGKDVAARFGIQRSMVSLINTGKYVERKHPLPTAGEKHEI